MSTATDAFKPSKSLPEPNVDFYELAETPRIVDVLAQVRLACGPGLVATTSNPRER